MAYNKEKVLKENIAAIKTALSDTPLSPEDIETLRAYKGFGGIKCILFGDGTYQSWIDQGASDNDLKLHAPIQELFNLLIEHFGEKEYKSIVNSLKNSVLTAYYTPNVLPQTFYEVLKDYVQVRTIYEPSAGSGVFLQEAFNIFPEIEQVCAYEKDLLTAIVLERITESEYGHTIYNKPFEESSDKENGKYDLITSNIPFGEMKIYDPHFKDNNLTGKIHNYFFAKGIEKIREGGILAFLVSDAFLNTVSNHTIRKYLFDRSDFISLTVMPDNLMQDTGGTMAPSHFLVVQKNTAKSCLSPEEELLVESSFIDTSVGKIAINHYLQHSQDCIIATGTSWGKNQYGKPGVEHHWSATIEEIATPFSEILRKDFKQRFNHSWEQARIQEEEETKAQSWDKLMIDNVPDREYGYKVESTSLGVSMTLADGTIQHYDLLIQGDEQEGVTQDDEASICAGCGTGMFGNEVFCFQCKEIRQDFALKTGGVGVSPNKEIYSLRNEELNPEDFLPEYVPFKDGIIVEL